MNLVEALRTGQPIRRENWHFWVRPHIKRLRLARGENDLPECLVLILADDQSSDPDTPVIVNYGMHDLVALDWCVYGTTWAIHEGEPCH